MLIDFNFFFAHLLSFIFIYYLASKSRKKLSRFILSLFISLCNIRFYLHVVIVCNLLKLVNLVCIFSPLCKVGQLIEIDWRFFSWGFWIQSTNTTVAFLIFLSAMKLTKFNTPNPYSESHGGLEGRPGFSKYGCVRKLKLNCQSHCCSLE